MTIPQERTTHWFFLNMYHRCSRNLCRIPEGRGMQPQAAEVQNINAEPTVGTGGRNSLLPVGDMPCISTLKIATQKLPVST